MDISFIWMNVVGYLDEKLCRYWCICLLYVVYLFLKWVEEWGLLYVVVLICWVRGWCLLMVVDDVCWCWWMVVGLLYCIIDKFFCFMVFYGEFVFIFLLLFLFCDFCCWLLDVCCWGCDGGFLIGVYYWNFFFRCWLWWKMLKKDG